MLQNAVMDEQVFNLYSGIYDKKGLDNLFPPEEFGCINFGYWEKISLEKMTLEKRIISQIKLYEKVLSYILPQKEDLILEIGCGRGHGIKLLFDEGIRAYGIDPVQNQIKTCQKNYSHIASRFKIGFAESIPFENELFNAIFSVEAAQHFTDFEGFAKESYRVLKNDGILTVSTFFLLKDNSINELKKLLALNISGIHNAIPIDNAVKSLTQVGFKNIEIHSIGKYVFKGFCKWAKEQELDTPESLNWEKAFQEELLDFVVIKAIK